VTGMRYKLLGRSGLRVSELGLGAMQLGWADRAHAFDLLETYAAANGNLLDTADVYGDGASEEVVGEFVKSDRDHWVITTKFSASLGIVNPKFRPSGWTPPPGAEPADVTKAGNHRKNIRRAVEASLRRLNTDYIDVYFLHFWDFTTQPDEVMRAFDDLVSAGKVLYPAISDTPAWVTAQAMMLSEMRGWAPLVAVQVEYSLAHRDIEHEILPMAHAFDLAVMVWSPLARGLLSGKYQSASTGPVRNGSAQDTKVALIDEVTAIASELGASCSQVALAWLRSRQQWAPLIPLLGVRNREQLKDNLGCLDVELDADHLARLDRVSAIERLVPADAMAWAQDMSLGGSAALLDHHRWPDWYVKPW
jgi:aryl-alcohol dehydrogenase-like predicted oxidoreductase